jgi:hypothetical protein
VISQPASAPAVPRLSFDVVSAATVDYAAVPTIAFGVAIDAAGRDVRSMSLNAQVRIDAARRAYDGAERRLLAELFGDDTQWSSTVRSLLWTNVSMAVPPFSGSTVVQLPVPCTYDFEVVASKYLDALAGGDVPLELLFAGTVFYTEDAALRVERISWDCEASYRMPVGVWRRTMDRYFPDSAWIRVDRDVFDRLRAFKADGAEPTWSSAIRRLLDD